MFRYLRFPTSTWGSLPPANSQAGRIYRVTDYGVAGAGILVISDGTRWAPLGSQCLGRSGVAASVTGTTAETALATVTVPAGLLGLNGGLTIFTAWGVLNTANNKTPRVRFGGIAGTPFYSRASTTLVSISFVTRLRNRNSASSQVGGAPAGISVGLGESGVAVTTSAVNTAVAQDVVISAQLGLGTESMSLENYEVWATP